MSSVTGSRLVNVFGMDEPDLSWPDAELSRGSLGGKGYGLARMTAQGLPVPPGFTLPTDMCAMFQSQGWTDELTDLIDSGLAALQRASGKRLGDEASPLLVSVRSGAAESMPGMMDTVLNVGMTEAVERGLAAGSCDTHFALDTHRRFLISYAEVVGGLAHDVALSLWDDPGCASVIDLRAAITAAGVRVPDDPRTQIIESVRAVFGSWSSARARAYRDRERIDHDLGTAATVQMMAFGNMGPNSGTGVAFTRCPSTGEPGLIGDFLVRAQGEDVVAGTHETSPLADMKSLWPHLYEQLDEIGRRLEHSAADMMDIEFTVERGTLWILQSRVAKRSPAAVLASAVDMAEDPDFPLDRRGAVERCRHLLDSPPEHVVAATDTDAATIVATGIAASPGRAWGVLCVDVDDAAARGEAGEPVVLVRHETSPSDVHGMAAAAGLVTALGGLVSHAAVVARAWGLPAVVGATAVEIDEDGIRSGEHRVEVGAVVTVDGTTGQLILGRHGAERTAHPAVETVRAWATVLESDTAVEPPDAGATLNTDRVLERALVLKGMATLDALDDMIGGGSEQILDELVASGRVEPKGTMWKPTAVTVREHRDRDAELSRSSGADLDTVLERFNAANADYKALVTEWQLRTVDGETVPNDHTDSDYDTALLVRLRDQVHAEVGAVLNVGSGIVPRLGDYRRRLDRALERLEGGDQRYMAHPLLDSYHTVWFELHEEFIRLTGRDRATEAAEGRA